MDRLTKQEIEKLRPRDGGVHTYHTSIFTDTLRQLCDLALQSLSLESVRSEAPDRETVSDGIPERCAQATIEGINKGLEGEELLAYIRRPISAAIEQARALTERQFSFLDKYESGGEEQTPETDKIVSALGESEDSIDTLIRHAKSLETRWRGAIRALSPARVAEGGAGDLSRYTCESYGEVPAPESPAKEQPGEQNAAPQVASTLQRESGSMLPAVAAPDVASMVKRLEQFAFHLRTIENQYAETMREKIDRNAAELMDQAAALLVKLGQGWVPTECPICQHRFIAEPPPEEGTKWTERP